MVASEDQTVGVQEVHAIFEQMIITLVSVREVLKRLKQVGVINSDAEGRYTLTVEAFDMLNVHGR